MSNNKRLTSKGLKQMSNITNMNVDKFLKIFSDEGIIFQPLNAELQEANVEQVYNIEEVSGVGKKVNGRWLVKEIK